PDGKALAVASGTIEVHTGRVMVWDVARGRERFILDGVRARAVAFSPVGAILGTPAREVNDGKSFHRLKLWDSATGQERAAVRGHLEPICGMAFVPDGGSLISSSTAGTVSVWDLALGREREVLGPSRPVSCTALSPDGRTLVVGSLDGRVTLWD